MNLSDVTIKPRCSYVDSRESVDLICRYTYKNAEIKSVPVIVANMDACGTIAMAKALYPYGIGVALHKYIPHEELVEFFKQEESGLSWYSMGINDADLFKYYKLCLHLDIPRIHIDTPNGYLFKFTRFIKTIRKECPDSIIMAGNVCTKEGYKDVADAGADIIKVGIAQGGWCDTSNKAAIGVPQLTAILDCLDTAHHTKTQICSDGGVRTPANIAVALAAGASFVMSGSLFMGYDECNDDNWEWEYERSIPTWGFDGEIIESSWSTDKPDAYDFSYCGNKRRKRLHVYGMASLAANQKYNGGLAAYKASEGKEGWVEPKGPASQLALDIRGSLASTCTYTNHKELQNLIGYGQFIRMDQ